MNVLITGGSGFIGKRLINYLSNKNYKIMLIGRNLKFNQTDNVIRKKFDLNNFSLKDQEIIDFNPDIFVHLAWEGIPDYSEETSRKNYDNTMKIVNFLLSSTNCSKIISTGSCWEYNDCNIIGECSEEIITDPKKPFSFYKSKIYKEVSSIANQKNVLFNWLRLFYVYGPDQKKGSIIPLIINSIKNKEEIKINYPANINDYIHVDDVAWILHQFIKKNILSGIYNVGSGKGVEVKTILKLVNELINETENQNYEYFNDIDKNNRNQNFYASTKKINKYIKNIELKDISTGIKSLI
jgi:nucleoside-diphosphate-sugar epimerase